MIPLNASDLRFLRWLASHCSPFGTTVGRISTVVARLARRGFIDRYEKKGVLTGRGWKALIDSGYPAEDNCGEARR